MKKIASVLLLALMIATAFSLCSCADGKTYDVVCTIFPQYDFCKTIVGDEDVSVKMLLPYGTDAHNYELTLGDKRAIQKAKLFVYIGGESEKWVKDVQKSTDLTAVRTIRWMDEASLIPLAGDHAHDHDDHDEDEYDEHVYLSIKNCVNLCMKLCSELSVLFPDSATAFAQNTENLVKELSDLDREYELAAQNARVKTLFFADRFPFAYLCRDYGVAYATPYKGCSADVEISAGDKSAFEKAYKSSGSSGLCILESGNDALAKSILSGTHGKTYRVHSLQSVSKEEAEKGDGYVELMRRNAAIFTEAMQ